MNPTFPYRPLDAGNDEIRLLHLLPLPEDEEERDAPQIECTLHHLSIADFKEPYKIWLNHTASDSKFKSREWADFLPEWAKEFGNFLTDAGREALIREERKRFTWGEYWALSYVWGDATANTKSILVDGVSFNVTQNLYLALCRLVREPRHVIDGEYLWVDSVCINQSDIQERDREVKRMGSIYSLARGVGVWLGEPAGPVEYFLTQWMDMLEQLGRNGLAEWLRSQPELAGAMCQSILILAQEPYWDRVWVIQELALASSQSVVYYGKVQARLDQVYSMLEFTNGMKGWTKDAYGSSDMRTVKYTIKSMGAVSRAAYLLVTALRPPIVTFNEMSSDEDSLAIIRSRILRLVAMAKATDPRDKVYGILALLPDTLSARITPNYSISKEAAWAMLSRAIIEETRSLGILVSKKSDLSSGLPSWVLNLDVAGEGQFAACRASGELGASFEFSSDRTILRCRGVEIDHVTAVGALGKIPEEFTASEVVRIDFPKILDISVLPITAGKAPLTDSQRISLLRALMGDPLLTLQEGAATVLDVPVMDFSAIFERINPEVVVEEGAIRPREPIDQAAGQTKKNTEANHFKEDPDSFTNVAQEWLDFATRNWEQVASFLLWRRANAGFDTFGHNLIDLFATETVRPCAGYEAFVGLIARAGQASAARTMVNTASGRVGIGASLVQPGDRIYVVLGCDWPLIMRPAGEKLEVVGSCFVDGFMLGEALRDIKCAEDVEWLHIV
jgi:hypothetical protein